jgi:hypothetical protein
VLGLISNKESVFCYKNFFYIFAIIVLLRSNFRSSCFEVPEKETVMLLNNTF